MVGLTIAWLAGYWWWAHTFTSAANQQAQIEKALHTEIRWSQSLLSELELQLTRNPDPSRTIQLPARYPIFVFNNGRLVYWSEHRQVPSIHSIQQGDSLFLYTRDESQYLAVRQRFQFQQQSLLSVVLIPLRTDFPVNNSYLRPGFNHRVFSNADIRIHPPDSEGEVIYSEEGNPLFSVELASSYTKEGIPYQELVIFSFMFLMACWFWLVGRWSYVLWSASKISAGFVVLVVGWGILRISMLLFGMPNSIALSGLFDLRVFYSSVWNPSLGDLLLNGLLIFGGIAYCFFGFFKTSWARKVAALPQRSKFLFASVGHMAVCSGLLLLFMLVESLYHNSAQLFLDITYSLDFPWVRWVGVMIVLVGTVGFFFLSHFSLRLSFRWVGKDKITFCATLLLGTIVPCLIFPEFWQVKGIVIAVYLFYSIVVYSLRFTETLTKFRYKTFVYIFFNLSISAAVLAFAVYFFEKERLINQKQRFASSLIIENDILGEFLLDEAGRKIGEDRFIATHLASPFLTKNSVLEKIRQVHLPDHFDRYNVEVYLFNSNGEPWYNTPPGVRYRSLLENYAIPEYATDYDDLYFIQELDANLSERYLRMVEIMRNDFLVGYVVLDLRLKRLLPNSVYPQLFVEQTVEQTVLSGESSYAIFQGGQMIFHSGSFNYYQDLDLKDYRDDFIEPSGVLIDGVHHWGALQPNGNLIVISTPLKPLSRIVANFSMFFLMGIMVTLLSLLIYAARFVIQGEQINFATKIQLYLNLSFFIPLLVVSISTVSNISSAYQEEVTEKYFNRARAIEHNIGEELTRYENNANEIEGLNASLAQLARHTESDIHLYNVRGELITSSQMRMVENGFISKHINPYALAEIRELRYSQVILDESIGDLDYKAVYLGLTSYQNGQLIGILSIPYFDAQQELGKEVALVLNNVINIFTLLFLLFLVGSYFLSDTLTFPLRLITQKIRKTTFSEQNTPLDWKSNDEIGLMVGEYNRMLGNLEASKQALARSEKESAWREMAKQVAHEIKNPLTPMKLTLQHMERKLGDADIDPTDFQPPISSLLKQVDTLSDIATSFSSFAKMPVPKNERFDLQEVVNSVVTLHQEDGNLRYTVKEGSYFVDGDAKLMGRIVSNLVINGIQSVPAGRDAYIGLSLSTQNEKVLLEIRDNGSGIAEDIQNKVFVPNFSTKYTGSGIGLAIAKRGIEHAGGRIWFETQLNVGTSFFIELPQPTE